MNEESDDSWVESSFDNISISKKGEKYPYKCPHPGCAKSFSRPSRLENHIRVHTGERPFKCDHCDKDYARAAHLRRHLAVTHSESGPISPEKLHCEDCAETFANKYSLSKHRKKFHLGKSFACDICSKSFSKHKILSLHRAEHFSCLPYSCETCGKTFPFPNKLKRHMESHNRKYECKVCGEKDFLTWSELRRHNKLTHKLNENTEFKCNECNKAFSSQKVLDKHSVIHGSDRLVYHCPEEGCTRFYCYEKNLTQHINTYHDEKRIKCTLCPKTFVNNAKLTYHNERYHSGDGNPSPSSPQSEGKEPRAKRKDKGTHAKSMAEVLSGFATEEGRSFPEEDKPMDIDAIRVEISNKPDLFEDFHEDSDEEVFPQDAVHICQRKFNINQTKASASKYII